MLNEFRVQTIIWDKANSKIYEIIKASEGDSNGRKLRVQILDNGKAINLSGTSLSLAWKSITNKGLDKFELVDANKGIFEIFYTTEMLSTSGKITASLVLIDSVGRLESDPFGISISRSIVDDDSVQSDNSFTALTEALVRVTDLEGNYAPRLNEVTAQLAQKATKGDIGLPDLNKNKIKFDGTWFSDDFLQELTNNEINTTYLHTESVTNPIIADQAVDETKIYHDLVTVNTLGNLADPKNVIEGGYYNSAGHFTESGSFNSSGLIPVEVGETYNNHGEGRQYSFWDAKGEFVEGLSTEDSNGVFQVPLNPEIKYVQFPYRKTGYLVLAKGNEPISRTTPYKKYVTFRNDELDNKLGIKSIDKNTNLFNVKEIVQGYYHYLDGEWRTSSGVSSVNFIFVKPGTKFTKNFGGHITYFNSAGEYLEGLVGEDLDAVYTAPIYDDLSYMCLSFNALVDHSQYEIKYVGGTPPQYEFADDFSLPKSIHLIDELAKEETTNLLDFNSLEPDVFYRWNTGEKVVDSWSRSTDLIPVTPDTFYSTNLEPGGHLTFWGGDGSDYIDGMNVTGITTFKVPDNPAIKFLRHSIYGGGHDTLTIVKGERLQSSDIVRFNPNERKIKVSEGNIADKSVGYNQLSDTLKKDIYSTEDVDTRYIKPFKRVENPVITKEMVTDKPDKIGVADPFIVMDKGRYHMFFEVLGANQSTDEIGHAYSDDLINWTYTQLVLPVAEHGHRSAYPHVFKHDGDWYMLPDTNSTIKLYKATNFPLEWEFVADLINGQFSDTNIFEIDSVWYLVSYGGELGRDGTSLYYNTSGSFANDNWQLHPVGLVIPNQENEAWTRPGGNPKIFDDYVLLPIQVAADGVYGRKAYLYKLSNISLTSCDATNLGVLVENGGDGDWTELSMHHVAHADYISGSIYAVDGQDSSGTYSIGLFEDVF